MFRLIATVYYPALNFYDSIDVHNVDPTNFDIVKVLQDKGYPQSEWELISAHITLV